MTGPVFLDTVGLLALWDEHDKWHAPAASAYRNLREGKAFLITTSFVLLECANAAAKRPYRLSVIDLQQFLEASGGLIFPTDEDWRAAWQAYQRGEAGQAGIVDQISFIVMRRLGLTQAFTNDRHFQAAGFETLF
jgi:predicted nucleic acid-binding protein